MKFNRVFTTPLSGPYKGIVWECRKSELRNSKGDIIFSMDTVVVPSFWSQIASDILAQKYLRKAGVPSEKEFAWKKYLDQFNRPEKDEDLLFIQGSKTKGGEYDARQVFHRLAYSWLQWGKKEKGIFDTPEDEDIFYEETLYMLAHQIAAPNSPQWFNTGLYDIYGISGPPQGHYYYDENKKKVVKSKNSYERPQPHACFILPIKDSMLGEDGIYDGITKEARLFKYGSGAGTNFSPIRGKNEKLSGGGVSSGLLSFLKIYDTSASSIKSGGTTRRASKIVTLNADHPDVEEFIEWKPKEEYKVSSMVVGSTVIKRHVEAIKKAIDGFNTSHSDGNTKASDVFNIEINIGLGKALHDALEDNVPENYLYQLLRHYEAHGTFEDTKQFSVAWGDEAYETVSGQSSNNTIRVTDAFMEAVNGDRDWNLTSRTSGEVFKTVKARDLWDKIIKSAWKCADPGLQFHDTINKWHTCPAGGQINASNPCGEFNFINGTACNLASINLLALYQNMEFNIAQYVQAIRIWTTILEISIKMAQFPAEEMAKLSYEYRPLGLGFAGLGSLLMTMGIPYDSKRGVAIASSISSLLSAESYCQSAEIARCIGKPFSEFHNNKEAMLNVIDMHKKEHEKAAKVCDYNYHAPAMSRNISTIYDLYSTASLAWEKAYILGNEYGFRNAQVTCIAPTGTIGLLMDCGTTGIEPDFALVKYKKLAGGGYFKIVNESLSNALHNLGYNDDKIYDIIQYIVGVDRHVLHNVIITLEEAKNNHHEVRLPSFIPNFITFDDDNIKKLSEYFDNRARSSLTIQDVFSNLSQIGEDNKKTLANLFEINFEKLDEPGFDLLTYLGLNREEINKLEEWVCGNMTIEGSPHLKLDHYGIFDTAALCGKKGTRCINWNAHINMMAAVQPFISGAISKTINMPSSATYNDIDHAYKLAWSVGLKSITVYRDQSKLSQPLSSFKSSGNDDDISQSIINSRTQGVTNEHYEAYIDTLSAMLTELEKENDDLRKQINLTKYARKPLPSRRNGHIQKTKIGGHSIFLHTGEYEDGKLGEIFIDMHREGAAFRSLLNSFAIAVSLGLQYGVPLEEYVDAFVFTKFEPNGMVHGHKHIKMVTSVIDYIFRDLAITYLKRTDLGQVKEEDLNETDVSSKFLTTAHEIDKLISSHPELYPQLIPSEANNKNKSDEDKKMIDELIEMLQEQQVKKNNKTKNSHEEDVISEIESAKLKGYEGDPCPTCGSFTLVRNGSCTKCVTCGGTTGCS